MACYQHISLPNEPKFQRLRASSYEFCVYTHVYLYVSEVSSAFSEPKLFTILLINPGINSHDNTIVSFAQVVDQYLRNPSSNS